MSMELQTHDCVQQCVCYFTHICSVILHGRLPRAARHTIRSHNFKSPLPFVILSASFACLSVDVTHLN